MGFFVILLFIASLILSEILKPSPRNDSQRPSALGDFSFPTATERRVVPIVWGTVKVAGPNVIWYGDLKPKAITERIKTGIFSSKNIITGYEYFLGIQMGICRGEVDEILRIFIDDEVLWEDGIAADGTIDIDKPNFFAGANGQGGVVGTLSVRMGSEAQSVVSYLTAFQSQSGVTPAYRGNCFVALEGMNLGTSTSIKPWQFEVRRIPNGLGLADPTVNDGNDCNPMNIIHEILTDDEWGLGLPGVDIDVARFTLAADTLKTEGNGFSMQLDSSREAFDMLQELQRHIDGVVFLNRTTGLWDVNLARGGYNIDAIPQLNPSNIMNIKNYTRGSWGETQNIVMVGFSDRAREYQETFAPAQDMANIRIQIGQIVKSEISYPGCKDANLASQLAWRDLRTSSFPLAQASLEVGREFALLNAGEVVAWTDPDLGFEKLPMRITKVDMGELTNGRVVLDCVQDAFVAVTPSFTAPGSGGWVPPVNEVVDVPLVDRQVFEAPIAFVDRDPDLPGLANRIWMGIRNQGDGALAADIVLSPDNVVVGTIAAFVLAGELKSAFAPSYETTGTITLDSTPDDATSILDALDDVTQSGIGDSLFNIALINGEFIGFTNAIAGGPGEVVLQGVVRGMMDTVPPTADGSVGDRVWFLSAGGAMTVAAFSGTVNLRPLTESNTDSLDFGAATSSPITMDDRAIRPYPPIDPEASGTTMYGGTVSIDISGAVGGTGDNTRGVHFSFTRRDFRLANEVDKVISEAVLPDDFPAANTTEYRVEVINDPDGLATSLFFTDWSSIGNPGISRNEILSHTNGVVPSRMRFSVEARHTVESVVWLARVDLDVDFDTTSSLTSINNLGAIGTLVASVVYTAPTTGIYNFDIGDALDPLAKVECRTNGGAWHTAISSGSSTGTNSATAGDLLEFRHDETAPGELRFLSIDAPASADDAYAILVL